MAHPQGTIRSLLLSIALAVGLIVIPTQSAEAFDVYTTPGYHTVNGREWHTKCEKYSSTVERCRTEIKADTIIHANGRFTQKRTWTFNNLTYKPSPRANWAGNILTTPGEHASGGRRWKTECDTAWTGRGACRSMIWTNSYIRTASGFGTKWQWVFNNIVRFTDSPAPAPTPTPTEFCVPAKSSVAGIAFRATDGLEAPEAPEATDSPEPAEELVEASEELVEPTEELRVASAVEANAVAPAAAAVTLTSVQHPDFPSGSLFDRLGAIEVQGSAPGGTEGAAVTVQLTDANGTVRSTAATKLTTGRFIVLLDGGFSGPARLTATVAGAGEATSDVTLHRAGVTLTGATRIDPLGTSTIAGKVNPGIGDVLVEAHVAAGGGWVKAGAGRTTSDGSYQLTYAHGKGTIGTSQVRVCAILPWGATIPSSSSMTIERPRIANAVVTNTTAAEVASTYRAGCPVGPNNLSTIRINQQSIDGRVYRGELIVRRDRAAEVADVFTRTFAAGFPVFQMTNPNAFGADDIKMMAANNTSGFNCRRVVGNPYAMSPHSYGYAVDLNPLQNPYRDPSGKWHPSTNHVSRTPVVPGMLTATSAPVVAFKAHGWSWFSGWDWHHFEKK